jgi:uncharacterized MAPEG superfamily protein
MSFSYNQAVQITILVTAILWVKVLYSNLMLGGAKMKAGKRAPEDTYQMSPDRVKPEALVDVDRAQRIVNNDAENVPYALIAAWASLFCMMPLTGSEEIYITHSVLVITFGVMRIGHTIAYRFALSYLRSGFWIFGVFATIGMIINGIVASFRV